MRCAPRTRRARLLGWLADDPWHDDRWPTAGGWAGAVAVVAVLAALATAAALQADPSRSRPAATTVPGRAYAGLTVEPLAPPPTVPAPGVQPAAPLGGRPIRPLPVAGLAGSPDGWQVTGDQLVVDRPMVPPIRWRAVPNARAIGVRLAAAPGTPEPGAGLGVGPAVRLSAGDTWLLARTGATQVRLLWVGSTAARQRSGPHRDGNPDAQPQADDGTQPDGSGPPLVLATYTVDPGDLAAGLALDPSGSQIVVVVGGIDVARIATPTGRPTRTVGLAALPTTTGRPAATVVDQLVVSP